VILSGKFAAGCESTSIDWRPHTEINDANVAEDAGALVPDEPEPAQPTVHSRCRSQLHDTEHRECPSGAGPAMTSQSGLECITTSELPDYLEAQTAEHRSADHPAEEWV